MITSVYNRGVINEDITGGIIGAAMKVLNTLRPGLDEKLYERAWVIELTAAGHRLSQQKAFPVRYAGREIGTLIPDLVVDDAVIVDPKVVTGFNDAHVARMLGYLNISGRRVALLLNFKYSQLRWKRVVL